MSPKVIVWVATALLVLAGVGIDLIGVTWVGAVYGELIGADPVGSGIGVADGVPSWTLQTAPTYFPLRKLHTGDALYTSNEESEQLLTSLQYVKENFESVRSHVENFMLIVVSNDIHISGTAKTEC